MPNLVMKSQGTLEDEDEVQHSSSGESSDDSMNNGGSDNEDGNQGAALV